MTAEKKKILNKLIDNSEYFPRYEIKVTGKRIEVKHNCHTFEDAEVCAKILLEVPIRSKAVITHFKNEFNSEILVILKNARRKNKPDAVKEKLAV